MSRLLMHLQTAAGVFVSAGLLFATGCATRPDANIALERFEFEEPQMGVPFRVILYARDADDAERAANAAFERIEELNAIMSDYETSSELSILSRTSEQGSPETAVSPDLWKVLEAAQDLAFETGGAFDITVGPCAALWRKARREKEYPDLERLENARRKTGYKNLVLNEDDRTARLLRYGMRLDLGGIAKGYAADAALQVLRSMGIRRALVAASGDLAIGDPPPGRKGWTVQIIGYDRPDGPPSGFAELSNKGVATSGDIFQRLEIEGVRYSHILDPFTCVGMTNHALATIIARDCMTADSLATTCTILPGDEALKLANSRDAALRVVTLKNETPVVKTNRRFDRLVTAAPGSNRSAEGVE